MELKLDYSQVRFQENGRLKLLIIVGTRPDMGHRTKRFFQWSGKMGERF